MASFSDDLRYLLFEDTTWFDGLDEASEDHWVLWRVTKSPVAAWWRELLVGAAVFARDRGLLDPYRKKFAGIPPKALADSTGEAQGRSPDTPIWEVANELIVGMLLERALGWELAEHEPKGHRDRVGDWLFTSSTGRSTFVEVKTIVEPARYPMVFTRAPATGRLSRVLSGAYRQLPRDDRSTLVVVVGTGLVLEVSGGIMLGDLFQTLFGEMQITFKVLPYVPGSEEIRPSFRDMFVHAGKHRRLGAVAGLLLGGLDTPGLGLYTIHNPFADEASRLQREDFRDVPQFCVDEDGFAEESPGINGVERWKQIVAS